MPKPNTVTSIIVDGNYVRSLLPAGWSWLYDYLPYMHALEIGSVPTFCAADPPTWTLPSATDLFNFITGSFVTHNDVVTQFLDKLAKSYLWSSLCQCSSGSTPAPSAPPAPPAGLPGINPGTVVTSPSNACAHFESPEETNVGPSTSLSNMVPFKSGASLAFPNLYPLPAGATTALLTVKCISHGAVHNGQSWSWQTVNAAGTVLTGAGPTVLAAGATLVLTIPIPATATSFTAVASFLGPAASSDNMQMTLDVYCGTTPGQQTAPCCPPDAISSGLLRQILEMVTLIQRQAVPFAYIASTVHSGLTGTGTVAVSGILALAASVTTLPTQLAETTGTPPKLYGVGWLSLATSDGYEAPVYLESANQLIVPRSAGLVTTVGYSLHSGVVLTLTELVREP